MKNAATLRLTMWFRRRRRPRCWASSKNAIMTPETDDVMTDADPMDPMNDDTPQARAVRFRKLSKFNQRNPLIWHNAHCGEAVLDIARYFLGR